MLAIGLGGCTAPGSEAQTAGSEAQKGWPSFEEASYEVASKLGDFRAGLTLRVDWERGVGTGWINGSHDALQGGLPVTFHVDGSGHVTYLHRPPGITTRAIGNGSVGALFQEAIQNEVFPGGLRAAVPDVYELDPILADSLVPARAVLPLGFYHSLLHGVPAWPIAEAQQEESRWTGEVLCPTRCRDEHPDGPVVHGFQVELPPWQRLPLRLELEGAYGTGVAWERVHYEASGNLELPAPEKPVFEPSGAGLCGDLPCEPTAWPLPLSFQTAVLAVRAHPEWARFLAESELQYGPFQLHVSRQSVGWTGTQEETVFSWHFSFRGPSGAWAGFSGVAAGTWDAPSPMAVISTSHRDPVPWAFIDDSSQAAVHPLDVVVQAALDHTGADLDEVGAIALRFDSALFEPSSWRYRATVSILEGGRDRWDLAREVVVAQETAEVLAVADPIPAPTR